ncbi:MAG: 2Fe-2S iron-sulfur cluster-binding protein [Candidatus Bipolaricaulia bacterium]
MPKINIRGQEEVEVQEGTILLRFIQRAGYDDELPAECDGQGTCSTCMVKVFSGVGEPNENEQTVLDEDQLEAGWRLSCQIPVTEDIDIIIPGYEPPPEIEVEPEVLRDILNYSANNFPPAGIPSSQMITTGRLFDLSNRVDALVDGGGDENDFLVLHDVVRYSLDTVAVEEIPSTRPINREELEELLDTLQVLVVAEEIEEEVLSYPYFFYLLGTIFVFVTIPLGLYSLFVNAPLLEPATPSFTPNPEKSPWYFIGIQELLAHFHPSIAGVIMPTAFVVYLMVIPYMEPYIEIFRRDRRNPPGRKLSDRPINTLFFIISMIAFWALIVIGQYFRGPRWQFVVPWG